MGKNKIPNPLEEKGFNPQPEPPGLDGGGVKISNPIERVRLNPQPEPPSPALNPQPEPPSPLGKLNRKAINPQPEPPKIKGGFPLKTFLIVGAAAVGVTVIVAVSIIINSNPTHG